MAIRAVHLEVVSDLTSDAFLAAFRRFVARRGPVAHVYSDNGTNFVGAKNELNALFSRASAFSTLVAQALEGDKIEWSFIPPHAPNFGGLWESSVKSFKRHLKRVIGDAVLTFEEFYTVCTSIEACLNSRPLSAVNFAEGEELALTPGHFLIGAPLLTLPEFCDVPEKHLHIGKRWNQLNAMRDHFWKRWYRECAQSMQVRSKWLYPNYDFQVGDIVLYKDDMLPATRWPLAKFIKLYTGSDGLSRVARVRFNDIEYDRPINKLIFLPVDLGVSKFYGEWKDENV